MKKGIILVVALAIIASIFVFRPTRSEVTNLATPVIEQQAPTVAVTAAGFHDLQEEITFHGRFTPNSQVNVVPKVAGRVGEVLVGVGDSVTRGQTIIRIEAEEIALQLRQAEAALQVAEANVARVKAGARPEEIEQAEAALRQAEANHTNVRINYERSEQLFKQGVISAREWEGIQAQYAVAQAQLVTAEKSLAIVKQGARAEDISSAEASLAQAKASVELAKLTLDNATIKAPISGQISRLSVEQGTMAGTGMAVATVVDIDTVKLDLQVTGRDVARMRVGQAATVTVDALPGRTFIGTVASISPAADEGSGLFAVRLHVPNAEHALKPGMYGSARVTVEQRLSVLAIPAQAVSTRSGHSEVFVIRDDVVEVIQVKVGISNNSLVEIQSGLDQGDQVVMTGRDSVQRGMKVQTIDWREVQ